MNKQDWTYKTFGEVGTFLRGKSIQKADFVEKGMPCIHYGQIHTKFGVSIDKHLSEIPLELYNKSIIASHGDVVIAITSEDLEGSCKSTAWLGDYDVAVSSHAAVYKHSINPKFIAYYLRSKSFYYEKMKYARGFKVMEIKPTDIEKIPIPVPPMAEQERIVEELDLLQGIIEKKKEQLKAYDQLAQSIFYTMFGDVEEDTPVSHYISALRGGKSLAGEAECKNKVLKTGAVTYDYFKGDEVKNLPTDYTPIKEHILKDGDILISRMNTLEYVGACAYVWKAPSNTYLPDRLWKATLKDNINPIFLWFSLIQDKTKEQIRSLASGTSGSMKNISIPRFLTVKIKCIPLSLQEEFAEKVESIERQKALIRQSIDEVQTMFDYTMDKYFG